MLYDVEVQLILFCRVLSQLRNLIMKNQYFLNSSSGHSSSSHIWWRMV